MDTALLEKIEAYLDGQLPREALELFAATAGVADLEREIAWVRDLRLAIEAEGVREQVARIAADPDTGNASPGITPARWIPYAMAAAWSWPPPSGGSCPIDTNGFMTAMPTWMQAYLCAWGSTINTPCTTP